MTAAETIEATAADLGLTVKAEFVPWSLSRRSGEKDPSLNWKIRLVKGEGRKHRCNCGHEWFAPVTLSRDTGNLSGEQTPWCPKCGKRAFVSFPAEDGREILTTDYSAGCGHCPSYKQGRQSADDAARLKQECESGRSMPSRGLGGRSQRILPKTADVLASLVLDADALERGTFEEWAGDLGYDTDSRTAEGIYRTCLEIGLKLRNGLGEDGLKRLREACEGY